MSEILIVRLGAMGDIIQALPAAASLQQSFPQARISWLVAPRWMPLLQGNPAIHRLIPFERATVGQLWATMRRVRALHPDLAIDFQGLLQSAFAGRLARPRRFLGFSREVAREPLAALLYDGHGIRTSAQHRVPRNLQLAAAAGATEIVESAFIPPGEADGRLPDEPYVLASPFAGWPGKEWPLARYGELALRLRAEGLRLVLNVAAYRASEVRELPHVYVHTSSLAGLIHATRQAVAIVGLDSGPLHLAAALQKAGVAIFGPTDPALSGPSGDSLTVLRARQVTSTYKRDRRVHTSMEAITAEVVHKAVLASLQRRGVSASV